MHNFVRALVAIALAATVAVPAYAATLANGQLVSQATSTTTGGISGTVTDDTGAPVVGAKITARGPKTVTKTSDAKGAFAFDNLPAGVYAIVAERAGYQTAQQADFAIFSGEVQKLSITLPHATFTSLRTIATVRSVGAGTFNTSPAAVDVVSNQDFVNQGATGVSAVLNEVPGLQNLTQF